MPHALLQPLVWAVCLSCLICLVLVATQRWHGRFTHDVLHGVQKFHENPTPRVGGLGIMLGLAVAAWKLEGHLEGAGASVLRSLLIAGLPAFLFGLADDLGISENAWARLMATLASGVLAWAVGGALLVRVGVPVLDALLQWMPLAVAFTAFALAGLANAFNIIDGFNGQSSGVVILILLALATIAWQVGDVELAAVALIITSAVAGFMLVNYPLGKIFLGDGGAYLLGFSAGCLAVLLLQRNAGVSPWALLLVVVYPVWEVAFSMLRRRRQGRALMRPDSLHLHTLLQRRRTRWLLQRRTAVWQNAAVAPMVWGLCAAACAWGVWSHANSTASIAGLCVFIATYTLVYRRLVRFRWG